MLIIHKYVGVDLVFSSINLLQSHVFGMCLEEVLSGNWQCILGVHFLMVLSFVGGNFVDDVVSQVNAFLHVKHGSWQGVLLL